MQKGKIIMHKIEKGYLRTPSPAREFALAPEWLHWSEFKAMSS